MRFLLYVMSLLLHANVFLCLVYAFLFNVPCFSFFCFVLLFLYLCFVFYVVCVASVFHRFQFLLVCFGFYVLLCVCPSLLFLDFSFSGLVFLCLVFSYSCLLFYWPLALNPSGLSSF